MTTIAHDPTPGHERIIRFGVLYKCTGLNEHQKTCGKVLLVWVPPGGREAKPGDYGRAEVKCRRCKTLNVIALGQ